MITTKDIAWLAGLLEGEGSFGRMVKNRVTGYWTPVIILAMTDRDVVARAGQLFGRTISGPYLYNALNAKPGAPKMRKPRYTVRTFGRRATGWMMTLYPLMGERRQGKIREILEAWRKLPSKSEACSARAKARWARTPPEARREFARIAGIANRGAWEKKTPEEKQAKLDQLSEGHRAWRERQRAECRTPN